jgi:tRNA(Ile)-lysidine synthase
MKSVSTRKLQQKNDLLHDFFATLDNLISEHAVQVHEHGFAVAYSGGLDSSVLLRLAYEFGKAKHLKVYAFHINHGLSPNASTWQAFCLSTATALAIPFFASSVHVDGRSGLGLEGSARRLRYTALGLLCEEHSIPLILTAHHQDDQAETLLLQLSRGTGIAGLSGMSLSNQAPNLLGRNNIRLARPLLAQSKAVLVSFAKNFAIDFVIDESNADFRFARNAIRHRVMPIFDEIFPDFANLLSRTAHHAQSAQNLLQELAEIDWQRCKEGNALKVAEILGLSLNRIDNLLRFWISIHALKMPTTARLIEIRQQLLYAADDARISILHDSFVFHRYQGQVFLEPAHKKTFSVNESFSFSWNGEAFLEFPQFNGRIKFEPSETGVDPNWLRLQSLSMRLRNGGERIRLGKNRPSRDIKHQFQYLKIPFWRRNVLPFVYAGGTLFFVAEVGIDGDFQVTGSHDLINLRWEFLAEQ